MLTIYRKYFKFRSCLMQKAMTSCMFGAVCESVTDSLEHFFLIFRAREVNLECRVNRVNLAQLVNQEEMGKRVREEKRDQR